MMNTEKDISQNQKSQDHSENGIKNNLFIYPLDSAPFGVGYAYWTALWWKWVLSVPASENPLSDLEGKRPSMKVSGPVCFLAGTTKGVAKRSCIIPSDKSILYPVLNFGATLADEPAVRSEEELVDLAKREMDRITKLQVTIDGAEISNLERFRIQSPIFDVDLPKNNLFGGPSGPTRGVSDGYWLFLEQLPRGSHRIESFGSCMEGQLSIGANYEIRVK
jgi:hypothetical protein